MMEAHTLLSFILLASSVESDDKQQSYDLFIEDFQFSQFGKISVIKVASDVECGMHCTMSDSKCGSFSIDAENLCSLSALRFVPPPKNKALVFTAQQGTRIFHKISGETYSFNKLKNGRSSIAFAGS